MKNVNARQSQGVKILMNLIGAPEMLIVVFFAGRQAASHQSTICQKKLTKTVL